MGASFIDSKDLNPPEVYLFYACNSCYCCTVLM